MMGQRRCTCVSAAMSSRYSTFLVTGLFLVAFLFYTSRDPLQHCQTLTVRKTYENNDFSPPQRTTDFQISALPNLGPDQTPKHEETKTSSLVTKSYSANIRKLPNDLKLKGYTSGSWIPKRFFTGGRFCNNFTYSFTIPNAEKCAGRNIFLILAVRSEALDTESRNLIRETWGAEDVIPGIKIARIFLFGKSRGRTEQNILRKENSLYGDIVQANFIDTYHNLPLKSMMAFKWAREYCNGASFFMMADADVFVDIFKVITYVKNLKSSSDSTYTLCKVEWTERPYRPASGNKAAIPESEYPGDQYSPYCWGGAYVAPISVINKLYIASLHTPRMRIDDVWIGILAARVGIGFPPTSDAFIQPWDGDKRRSMLEHIKYYDGPLMFAAYHGGSDYVHDQIRRNWARILKHYRPEGRALIEEERQRREKLSHPRGQRRKVHYPVVRQHGSLARTHLHSNKDSPDNAEVLSKEYEDESVENIPGQFVKF